MQSKITILFLCFFSFLQVAQALPIDWNGQFGYDTNLIKNVQRSNDPCTGGYCVPDDEDNARFQSFVLKLRPSIVVNDSATVKAEISTGNIRGGFAGQDTQGRASYFAQSPNGTQTLTINQIYAELFADTALFKVGKFSKNFGLGAVINDGDQVWDRFFSVYNGLEARFNLGKFSIAPVFAKIQSPSPTGNITDTTTAASQTGKYDTDEVGLTASYIDPNSNFEFSVYYGVRKVETNSELYGPGKGPSEVTLVDVYFNKAWDKFKIAMEIPMLTGDVGTIYGTTQNADIDATAFILESTYQLNPKWMVGLGAGVVPGYDGQDDFSAIYLHPNYKIAELMFAYNFRGFQNGSNIFDASVTNANYARVFANFSSEAWTWRMAVIMGKANETASTGNYFNQETFSIDTATAEQKDDLGLEADLAFDYQWSPNIIVTGYIAYWQVGDFYGFTGSETVDTADITASALKLSMSF